jgi:hypothetical protein
MKYIKKFENIKNIPEIGDYIIFKNTWYDENFDGIKFLCSNIGKIVKIEFPYNKKNALYHVNYENIPNDISHVFSSDNTIAIDFEDIKHFSPDKKELETYLMADKYNL